LKGTPLNTETKAMEPQKRINKPKKPRKEAKLTPVHRELNTRPKACAKPLWAIKQKLWQVNSLKSLEILRIRRVCVSLPTDFTVWCGADFVSRQVCAFVFLFLAHLQSKRHFQNAIDHEAAKQSPSNAHDSTDDLRAK